MRSLNVLVGKLSDALPSGKYHMIEWCGFDIFIFTFFDKISMKRTSFNGNMRSNGCFLIPILFVDWIKHFPQSCKANIRIIRDEDGEAIFKCIVKYGHATHSFRCNASERTSIEWDIHPIASVEWTNDMNIALRSMEDTVHVDMHQFIKFSSGCSCSVIEKKVEGCDQFG